MAAIDTRLEPPISLPVERREGLGLAARAGAPRSRVALTRPALDTWLAGGLSLVALAVIAALWPLSNTAPSIGYQLRNLATIAPTLALVINYPHFLASYRLAYAGRDSVLRHSFTLLLVPVALAAATILAFATYNSQVVLFGRTVDGFGSRLAGWLVEFMFLTVGWHYVKQAYGCARVGARLRDFPVPRLQAVTLRYALFPLWIAVWVRSNTSRTGFDYSGVSYGSLHLPHWLVPLSNAAIAVGAITVGLALLSLQRHNRRTPPLLMIVPLAAMFAWWVPAAYNPTYFVLVPMFHSLQYLPFAYKVERGRIAHRDPDPVRVRRTVVITAIAIAVAGWIAFEIGPNIADSVTHSSSRLGVALFAVLIPVFVNIHHYFIDHVIWRSGEPGVSSYLLAPTVEPAAAS